MKTDCSKNFNIVKFQYLWNRLKIIYECTLLLRNAFDQSKRFKSLYVPEFFFYVILSTNRVPRNLPNGNPTTSCFAFVSGKIATWVFLFIFIFVIFWFFFILYQFEWKKVNLKMLTRHAISQPISPYKSNDCTYSVFRFKEGSLAC